MKLNHVLLRIQDMEAMQTFFERALGLEEGFRPPFPFDGKWIYGDEQPIFHMVGANPTDNAQAQYLGSVSSVNPVSTGSTDGLLDHIALEGKDYESLMTRLREHEYQFIERTVPESKQHQVFVFGPEGLKIEIVFAQNKKPL